jgi:hypothetical protein
MLGAKVNQIGQVANTACYSVKPGNDNAFDFAALYRIENLAYSWPSKVLGTASGVADDF